MRARYAYLILAFSLTLAVGVLLGGMLNFSPEQERTRTSGPKSKLERLLNFIDSEYVDNVNTDSIVDETVTQILEKLDPHSVYISSGNQEEMAQLMKGDFVGIGVNFYMYRDTLSVIVPIADGPSEKAGILPGDRILYAGKNKLFGRSLTTDSLFSVLKGEVGSKVQLLVYRKNTGKTFKTTVTRDVVPIKSVDIGTMIAPGVGYIKINRFAATTYAEFEKAALELKKSGIEHLVIDVRDNSGGYLDEAVKIADDFLTEGQLIVFTKNKKGRIDRTFASSKGHFENTKVTVLINESSASASEILAGAIQDNDRGTIVGRRSFGKGLVQREMDFRDGSSVRLTVARYYTPTGRSIQKAYSGDVFEYHREFASRFDRGELYEQDSIHIADTLKFRTPKGKVVYGGGGIVPDVFVPLEADHGNEAVGYLMQSGMVGFFVFEQLDSDRESLLALGFDGLVAHLGQSDVYFNRFRDYLSSGGLRMSLEATKPMVKRYLAAEFARQLFGEEKYYAITLKDDPMVKAVLSTP